MHTCTIRQTETHHIMQKCKTKHRPARFTSQMRVSMSRFGQVSTVRDAFIMLVTQAEVRNKIATNLSCDFSAQTYIVACRLSSAMSITANRLCQESGFSSPEGPPVSLIQLIGMKPALRCNQFFGVSLLAKSATRASSEDPGHKKGLMIFANSCMTSCIIRTADSSGPDNLPAPLFCRDTILSPCLQPLQGSCNHSRARSTLRPNNIA